MSRKLYKAYTTMSLSVSVGGGYRRVDFTPLSAGYSLYATDDPLEQAGLEAHDEFRKAFWLASSEAGEPEVSADDPLVKALEAVVDFFDNEEEVVPELESEDEAVELETVAQEPKQENEVIVVASQEDAREILNERYDIPKSRLRSKAKIEAEAEEVGIQFEWL